MTIEEIAKIVGVVGAIGLALNHFLGLRKAGGDAKSNLLLDLQIYEKVPDNIEGKKLIETEIVSAIELLYSPSGIGLKNLAQIAWFNVFVAAILGFFTYFVSRNGFSWWSVPLGLITLVTVVAIADAIKTHFRESEKHFKRVQQKVKADITKIEKEDHLQKATVADEE